MEASIGLSYILIIFIRKFRYFQNKGTFLWNLVPYSELRKFHHGPSIVARGLDCFPYILDRFPFIRPLSSHLYFLAEFKKINPAEPKYG